MSLCLRTPRPEARNKVEAGRSQEKLPSRSACSPTNPKNCKAPSPFSAVLLARVVAHTRSGKSVPLVERHVFDREMRRYQDNKARSRHAVPYARFTDHSSSQLPSRPTWRRVMLLHSCKAAGPKTVDARGRNLFSNSLSLAPIYTLTLRFAYNTQL